MARWAPDVRVTHHDHEAARRTPGRSSITWLTHTRPLFHGRILHLVLQGHFHPRPAVMPYPNSSDRGRDQALPARPGPTGPVVLDHDNRPAAAHRAVDGRRRLMAAEPEGKAEPGIAVLVKTRATVALTCRDCHGQNLPRDHVAVIRERPGQLGIRGGPPELDPVGHVQAVVLACVLDQPDDLTGEPEPPQLRRDLQVERDGFARRP